MLLILKYLDDTDKTIASLQNHPLMKKMFMRFNTTLPYSASVERLFSYRTATRSRIKISKSLCFSKQIVKSNVLNLLPRIRGVARKFSWGGQVEPQPKFLTPPKNFTPDLGHFKTQLGFFSYFVKKIQQKLPKLEHL